MNRYLKKAGYIIKNKTRVRQVLMATLLLLKSKGALGQVKDQVFIFMHMIQDTVQGTYPGLSKKNLILAVAGLTYLISPLDLVPDFFAVVGFGDDIALLTWIFSKLAGEVKKYVQWRKITGRDPQPSDFHVEEGAQEAIASEGPQYRVSEDDLPKEDFDQAYESARKEARHPWP